MAAGVAGALLVFTGLWHALEWLMHGRNRDTVRLIPVGLLYLTLGCLIVTLTGGWITQAIAVLVVCAGMIAALVQRKRLFLRNWVIWAFIVIDAVIVISLIRALLAQ